MASGASLWILEYDITSEGKLFDGVGSHNGSNQGTQMPEWRANVVLDWRQDNHYVRASVRYISELIEDNPNNVNTEETAFSTVDLLYQYTLPWGDGGSSLTLSVVNLADEEDPFKDNSLSTSTSMVYDQRGRRVGLSWVHAF